MVSRIRFIVIALVLSCISAFPPAAWALITPELTDAPTDDGYIWCAFDLGVSIDEGLAFAGGINVVLYDINGGNRFSFVIGAEHYSRGGSITGELASRTTYKVYFDYPGIDGFALVHSSNGATVDTFTAYDNGAAQSWRIVAAEGRLNNAFSDIPDIHSSGLFAPSPSPVIAGQGEYGGEAQALLDGLVTALGVVDMEGQFGRFLTNSYIVGFAKPHAADYAEITGGAEEEYLEMGVLERFIWRETYIKPIILHNLGMYGAHFIDEDVFLSNFDPILTIMDRDNQGAVSEAFKALLLWQYRYFQETTTFYNFMTGTDYRSAAVQGAAAPTAFPSLAAPEPREDDEEIEPSAEGLQDAPEQQGGEENPGEGIWEGTLRVLRKSWFSILILLAAAGALVTVIVLRKRKDAFTPDD